VVGGRKLVGKTVDQYLPTSDHRPPITDHRLANADSIKDITIKIPKRTVKAIGGTMRKAARWGLLVFIGQIFFWLISIPVVEARASSEVVIKLRPGARIETVLRRYGTRIESRLWNTSTYRLNVPSYTTREHFLTQLQGDNDIEQARVDPYSFQLSPQRRQTTEPIANRPIVFREGRELYEKQRAFSLLNIKQAHSMSRGAGSLVAIIDTGCDTEHPLLRGRISPLSHDFVDSDDLPAEVAPESDNGFSIYGHGTFVAGIVSLAAPQADLMILRAFDSEGMASSFDVANALRYAADLGATVVNLSCSAGVRDDLVFEAILYARARGVAIVVAAGNDNVELPIPFPAAEPQVIAVAATDLSDVKAKFSNFGNHIDCMAPGTGIFSIYPGSQFAAWSGTSFAAPWVSACLALLRAGEIASDQAAIESIKAGSVNISRRNPVYIGKLGAGRLSIGNSLRHYWNKKQELFVRSQTIGRFRPVGSRSYFLSPDF
jgi:hypothetical protein